MRSALALASVFLGALSACGEQGTSSGVPQKRPTRVVKVGTVPVGSRPLSYQIQAIGSLEAYQTVTVPARVEGVVEKLAFEEGDSVTPEKVLAVIDGQRYALERRQAEAMVAKATAAVTQAEAAVAQAEAQKASAAASRDEAKANLARREEVRRRAPGTISGEEIATFEAQLARFSAGVDEAAAQAGQAAAQVGQAKASVADAEARLALARKSEADSEIRSPIAGTVESKTVSTGQYVKVGAGIATLVDARSLRLRFRVAEAESVRLTKESPIHFHVQGAPQRAFSAELFHVNGTADPTTRMVECTATVKDADPALKPGFFASVAVETGTSGAAVVVPEEAILSAETGFVAFVVVDGKARRRALALGLRTKDGEVEVLSGLAAGEVLVVEGASVLADGSAVELKSAGGAGASTAPDRARPGPTSPGPAPAAGDPAAPSGDPPK